jgi:hypothetical protein
MAVGKGFCSNVQSRQTLKGAADLIVRTASLLAAEIAHVLPEFEPRAFRIIATDQFPTNSLIMMIEKRNGDMFKVRNPIRNLHDKLTDILYRAFIIEFKGPEMN